MNELEELNLLNQLIELGAKAAHAHAQSNSDDGHKGTAAYVQWHKLRAEMGELIRRFYAAAPQPAPATQQAGWTNADADAARLALELECLLMDTKDTAVVSKWWQSANEALELHRARLEGKSITSADL